MLVYQNTVAGFLADVDDNMIDSKVQAKVRERLNMGVSDSELTSWGNSLVRVAAPLRRSKVPEDAGVSIECQLPMSSKRLHPLGLQRRRRTPRGNHRAQAMERGIGDRPRRVGPNFPRRWHPHHLHPSYQAWSYAEYLHGFNETVELEGIHLQPCAFLHNCTDGTAVLDKRYDVYTEWAPVFLKQNVSDLRGFLSISSKPGTTASSWTRSIMAASASKSLADSLVALLKNNASSSY